MTSKWSKTETEEAISYYLSSEIDHQLKNIYKLEQIYSVYVYHNSNKKPWYINLAVILRCTPNESRVERFQAVVYDSELTTKTYFRQKDIQRILKGIEQGKWSEGLEALYKKEGE